MDVATLVDALTEHGVLLVQDATLPSVAGLIVGAPVRGSWWGHPLAHTIYARVNELADHADVLRTILVSRKVTLVHRRLWGAILAVATARDAWQMDDLDPEAHALLTHVDREGETRAKGARAKALEDRMLVRATEVHTDSGAHAKVLTRWVDWPGAVGLRLPTPCDARATLERTLDGLNARWAARATLPWRR